MPVPRWSISTLFIVLGVTLGCTCTKNRSNDNPHNDPESAATDAGQPANAPGRQKAFRCSAVNSQAVYALGFTGGAEDDDDSGLDVPFGINIGQAMGYEGGFAVSAIDASGKKNDAILALWGSDAKNARRIDLGRVFGDADPPRVAGNDRSLVAAVADLDAAGQTLRLVRVDEPAISARVVRGPEISASQSPFTVFSIAVNATRGIVVWDESGSVTEQGHIAAAPFAVQNLALPQKPLILSSRATTAESPQVVQRPGGFWAAWVQSPLAHNTLPHLKPRPPEPLKPDQTSNLDNDNNLPAVELGVRELSVTALDMDGHAIGKPIKSTESASHIVAYDLAPLEDGSALLAWRDDENSPGVESQVVHLARVGLDGHVERFRLEDESIGVGAPQLLMDPKEGADNRAWLAVGDAGEKVSLVKLQPSGMPTSVVAGDAELGAANPLARFGGTLLVARQRGKGVELEQLRCQLQGQ